MTGYRASKFKHTPEHPEKLRTRFSVSLSKIFSESSQSDENKLKIYSELYSILLLNYHQEHQQKWVDYTVKYVK